MIHPIKIKEYFEEYYAMSTFQLPKNVERHKYQLETVFEFGIQLGHDLKNSKKSKINKSCKQCIHSDETCWNKPCDWCEFPEMKEFKEK